MTRNLPVVARISHVCLWILVLLLVDRYIVVNPFVVVVDCHTEGLLGRFLTYYMVIQILVNLFGIRWWLPRVGLPGLTSNFLGFLGLGLLVLFRNDDKEMRAAFTLDKSCAGYKGSDMLA